jgi:hypothetical protein
MERESRRPVVGDGSDIPLARGHSEPTPNAPQAKAGLHPVDLAYHQHGDVERKLRIRLHQARDVAARRAWQKDTGPGTRAIYLTAQEGAAAWVFRPASVEQLQSAVTLATRLFQAASIAERLEGGDGE